MVNRFTSVTDHFMHIIVVFEKTGACNIVSSDLRPQTICLLQSSSIAACDAKPMQMYILLHAIQFFSNTKCNNTLLVGSGGGGGSSSNMVLAGSVFRGTMSKFGTLSLTVMRRLPG